MACLFNELIKKIKTLNFPVWRSRLYVLGLIIGGLFFVYQLFIGINSIVIMKLNFDKPLLIIVSIGLSIIIALFQMFIWNKLMQELGIFISFIDVIKGYELSFLPRYIPGSIWGYASRSEWLSKEFKVAPEITNIGSALELVLFLIANLGWSLSVFLFSGWHKWILPLVSPFFSVLIIAILKLLLNRGLFIIKFPSKLMLILKRIRLFSWFYLSIQMVLFWALQGFTLLLILLNLEMLSPFALNLVSNQYLNITGSYCLAWLIGFLIFFIPSGLGVREGFLSKELEKNYSLSHGISSSASIIMRIYLAFGEIFWILISVVILKPKSKTKLDMNK